MWIAFVSTTVETSTPENELLPGELSKKPLGLLWRVVCATTSVHHRKQGIKYLLCMVCAV